MCILRLRDLIKLVNETPMTVRIDAHNDEHEI